MSLQTEPIKPEPYVERVPPAEFHRRLHDVLDAAPPPRGFDWRATLKSLSEDPQRRRLARPILVVTVPAVVALLLLAAGFEASPFVRW